MSFNNGNERRKLNAKWEHLRVQYREAGMSEDAIQAMYEFDLGVLNSERAYITNTLTVSDTTDDSTATETSDFKQYEKAIALWEKTTQQKPTFAMAWRNLCIAYYNKHQDGNKALAAMEKVCLPKAPSARFLLEYDQLAARMNHTTNQRLAVLDENFELVKQRDD